MARLDPDPPYTPQAKGLATQGPIYDLTKDLIGGAYQPLPFTGMRAVTPFSFHVNPYFYLADASEALTDTSLQYSEQLSRWVAVAWTQSTIRMP